jgi:hypothetical protein
MIKLLAEGAFFQKAGWFMSFVAFSLSAAIGGHKLSEMFSEPAPSYILQDVSYVITVDGSPSSARVTFVKVRPECNRKKANIQFTLKDGTTAGPDVDMRGNYSPGKHIVVGLFTPPPIAFIDFSKPVLFFTRHECGEGNPDVYSECVAYRTGERLVSCKETSTERE